MRDLHEDLTATDRALEAAVLTLLAGRADTATLCPSEAARAVHAETGHEDPEGWRDLMDATRRATERLVAAAEVEVTQGGAVVDPGTATGPIRIRRRSGRP